jgi:hypothetical protein
VTEMTRVAAAAPSHSRSHRSPSSRSSTVVAHNIYNLDQALAVSEARQDADIEAGFTGFDVSTIAPLLGKALRCEAVSP